MIRSAAVLTATCLSTAHRCTSPRPWAAGVAAVMLLLASSSSAQSAGPPDAATAPPAAPAVELLPELAAPAEGEAGAVSGDERTVPVAFVGLWAAPGEAALREQVDAAVRHTLDRPPFALVTAAGDGPLAPACLEDAACLADQAGEEAQWTVAGSLTIEATQLKLSLVLLEPTTGARFARASIAETSNQDGQARLLASVDPVVHALVQTLDPAAGPAVPPEVAVPEETAEDGDDDDAGDGATDAAVAAQAGGPADEASDDGERVKIQSEPSPTASEGSPVTTYGAWIWSGAFLGAGALLAVGGIAFDLFSPTSVDTEITVIDGLGPGLVLVGASVALIGLAANPFLWMALAEDDDGT